MTRHPLEAAPWPSGWGELGGRRRIGGHRDPPPNTPHRLIAAFLLVQLYHRERRSAQRTEDVETAVLGAPDPDIVATRREIALRHAKLVNPLIGATGLSFHIYTALEARPAGIPVTINALFAVWCSCVVGFSGPWRSLSFDEQVWLYRSVLAVQVLSIFLAATMDTPESNPSIAFLFTGPLVDRIVAGTAFIESYVGGLRGGGNGRWGGSMPYPRPPNP